MEVPRSHAPPRSPPPPTPLRAAAPAAPLQIIPASCLQGSGLVLPAEFRDEVVKDSGAYTLQNSQGKQWPCTITRKTQVGRRQRPACGLHATLRRWAAAATSGEPGSRPGPLLSLMAALRPAPPRPPPLLRCTPRLLPRQPAPPRPPRRRAGTSAPTSPAGGAPLPAPTPSRRGTRYW